ncbi:MAG: DUF362 domain-containing protein [Bacteroidales bacterium]|nr:DUF362 domain-containing protein [Bacteroidales bacterium]
MKKATIMTMAALALLACGCGQKKAEAPAEAANQAVVYMTRDISPESLVKIYEALGVKASGKVAVKISTGENGNPNYLKPELIGQLVEKVNGRLVECNTAYAGKRTTFEEHKAVIEDHGFNTIGGVDLMDEDGEMQIPVADTQHIKYDIVGSHLADYDFMINLAHFKGHPMGGLGGVLKNASIGVASSNGKAYIHTAGRQQVVEGLWSNVDDQDGFLESMAAAAQAVHNYFKQPGKDVVYIAVMNNMSVDCDCSASPSEVVLKDYGILASTDPVALDKACVDIIFNMQPSEGNDNAPLVERINSRHGLLTIERAEAIGLGTTNYRVVSID